MMMKSVLSVAKTPGTHDNYNPYLPTATHLGYFYSFVTHSLIVTHFLDWPLFLEKLPLILMSFSTHFH